MLFAKLRFDVLYKILGLIAATATLMCNSTNLHAQGYCSLSVTLVDPQGNSVDAKVSVQERDGRTIEKMATLGSVQFCDLGITPVSITVGDSGCNQAILRNVGVRWGITTKVRIIYDQASCNVDGPPVAACQMLFRFADPAGHWLSGVVLRMRSPYDQSLTADEFGRLLIRTPAFKELLGSASIADYDTAEIRMPCISENYSVEQHITLKKTAR
jgi:hypothetical protein